MTQGGHVLDLRLPRGPVDGAEPGSEALAGVAIFTTFVDAQASQLVGEDELRTRIHYMTGNDRDDWDTAGGIAAKPVLQVRFQRGYGQLSAQNRAGKRS